ALYEMSGRPRIRPSTTPAWNSGRLNTTLRPPPPAAGPPSATVSFQVVSEPYAPLVRSAVSLVPPTAVTRGSDAGVLAALKYALPSHVGCAEPESPDDANSVTP